MIGSLPRHISTLTYLDEADRIADERDGMLFALHAVRNPVPMAPVCNPHHFLRPRRHQTRHIQFWHAAIHDRLYDPPFFLEEKRIEGYRISSAIGQRRRWGNRSGSFKTLTIQR